MDKVKKVMGEYKHGKLHSGSNKGPEVKKRSQAVAIALSEARKGLPSYLKNAWGTKTGSSYRAVKRDKEGTLSEMHIKPEHYKRLPKHE